MDFLWGVATSAHQVEGQNVNDWSNWERKNAGSLARKRSFKSRLLSFAPFADFGEKISSSENYLSGSSVNHYEDFEKDLEIIEELGLNSFRLSIEWSRIEPEEGVFDEEEIEHYREVLEEMNDRGIEPVVTLWHFTNPRWFVEKYGWDSKKAPELFSRYVEKIVEELGEHIEYWLTFNELRGWLMQSYLFNNWPPENTKRRNVFKADRNFSRAHRSAYEIIKKEYPDTLVSLPVNAGYIEPYTDNIINRKISGLFRYFERDRWIEKEKDYMDFISLNHYAHIKIDFLLRNFFTGSDRFNSDMMWPQSPQSIYQVLKDLDRKYDMPIMITEHGVADSEDEERPDFIRESIEKIDEAREEGVEVLGYLHWSLIDNFEWDKGKWPRFGLVEYDYDSSEKTKRRSAEVYSNIVEEKDWNVEN